MGANQSTSSASRTAKCSGSLCLCGTTSLCTCCKCYFGKISIERAVWEDFKDYKGRVKYYLFRTGLHGVICFQNANGDCAATADLVVGNLAGIPLGRNQWHVRCKKSKWDPKNREVYESEYEWHIGTVLVRCNEFGKQFGSYDAFFRNCFTWQKEVVKYLKDRGPASHVRKPQSLGDLRQLAEEEEVLLYLGKACEEMAVAPQQEEVEVLSEEPPHQVTAVAPQQEEVEVQSDEPPHQVTAVAPQQEAVEVQSKEPPHQVTAVAPQQEEVEVQSEEPPPSSDGCNPTTT